MSEVDLRLAEMAEDRAARQIALADSSVAVFRDDPHWFVTTASSTEMAVFAHAVLKLLRDHMDPVERVRRLQEVRNDAFTATAVRMAAVED